MQVAQRHAVGGGDPFERKVGIREMRLDPLLDGAQAGLLDRTFGRGHVAFGGQQREGQHVHQLVAEAARGMPSSSFEPSVASVAQNSVAMRPSPCVVLIECRDRNPLARKALRELVAR